MVGCVKRQEESHKLPGPVSCHFVTDVLFTAAVAFYIPNTDLDRYICRHALRGKSCASTNTMSMQIYT